MQAHDYISISKPAIGRVLTSMRGWGMRHRGQLLVSIFVLLIISAAPFITVSSASNTPSTSHPSTSAERRDYDSLESSADVTATIAASQKAPVSPKSKTSSMLGPDSQDSIWDIGDVFAAVGLGRYKAFDNS